MVNKCILIILQLSIARVLKGTFTYPLRLGPLHLFLVHRKRKAVRATTHILSRARLGAAKRAPALGQGFSYLARSALVQTGASHAA